MREDGIFRKAKKPQVILKRKSLKKKVTKEKRKTQKLEKQALLEEKPKHRPRNLIVKTIKNPLPQRM